jgi:hypothetical protein
MRLASGRTAVFGMWLMGATASNGAARLGLMVRRFAPRPADRDRGALLHALLDGGPSDLATGHHGGGDPPPDPAPGGGPDQWSRALCRPQGPHHRPVAGRRPPPRRRTPWPHTRAGGGQGNPGAVDARGPGVTPPGWPAGLIRAGLFEPHGLPGQELPLAVRLVPDHEDADLHRVSLAVAFGLAG